MQYTVIAHECYIGKFLRCIYWMVRRKPIWVIMIATYYIQIHIAVLQHSIQYTQIVSVGNHGFETYAEIADEVLRPGAEEQRANPRSSSAKLRWARRAV